MLHNFIFFTSLVIVQTLSLTPPFVSDYQEESRETLWTQQGEIHATAPLKGQ